MRNLSTLVPYCSIMQVCFDSSLPEPISEEEMNDQYNSIRADLLSALEADEKCLTPSEESVLEDYDKWFQTCRQNTDWGPFRRAQVSRTPRGWHLNTVFVYQNFNTGKNLLLIPATRYDGVAL